MALSANSQLLVV